MIQSGKANASLAPAEDRTMKRTRKSKTGTTTKATPGGRMIVFRAMPKYANRPTYENHTTSAASTPSAVRALRKWAMSTTTTAAMNATKLKKSIKVI